MSKAFVKEDGDAPADSPPVPARAGKTQPITSAGYARLQEERARLADSDATRARVAFLDRVLASVEVVAPQLLPGGGAGFGCEIEVEIGADGEEEDRPKRRQRRRYVLVGPDEVDAAAGRITADSPVGRALLGRKPGEAVELPRGGNVQEARVLAVRIADA